ncbi:MAG TPA: hypothetical protein VEF04_19290, partial [Blastocatellia bacterium]|nr:hypothetical protein [Blastocatellia bacterium]
MSTSTIEVKTSSRFVYGWLIVAVATLAMLVTNGLTIGGLPVFFAPMLESLRLPKEVTAFGSSLTLWASGLFSLPVGWLVRRFSLRVLMT